MERASCTTVPATAVPPFGVSAVLRSVNQVVADRRGRRPVLRTLVVSGIAGAAWPLSAAAAHAAEPETPTEAAHRGPGVFSLVNDLGTGVVEERAPSLVGELLTPAAEVTAALPTDHLPGTGISARNDTAMPARQPAEPDAPAHPLRTLVTGDGAEREPVAPIRLTGGPTGSADPAVRDAAAPLAGPAGRGGPDPKPGPVPSRPLGDLTRLVGTTDTPAEHGSLGIDSAAAFPDVVVLTPVTPITGVTAASTAPSRVSAAAVVTGLRPDSKPERAARSAPIEPLPVPRRPHGRPGAASRRTADRACQGHLGRHDGNTGRRVGSEHRRRIVRRHLRAVTGTMGAASGPPPRRDAELVHRDHRPVLCQPHRPD
ncbi:hypothetical protein J2S43_006979 [Catenuloplanes nepalensis]|uniref:Secreted protein n=1 Tax=Catenuloplanes nepalensis TaxID=587533 RepID=A0ABT9N450_9ACTN|nr:hypothetical protein [Catenuloplanes nepalensis]MDP9798467.1 hypothetical protein [Catenuloplanes nepalensis]